jgi:hypothetical protein
MKPCPLGGVSVSSDRQESRDENTIDVFRTTADAVLNASGDMK